MKKIMLGNEAVARGLYESGCRLVSSYPGTPSTEITEYAAKYDEIYAEWAPNEKVAAETAIGASMAGGRAFCGMKHVGLNVAADPLFIGAYVGVGGGMIIGVADDPGMHSSQNEQDSRHYAEAAKLPMLEPSDSEECLEFTKQAFELSERFDTPVILRLMTRVSHSQSAVELSERCESPLVPYEKNAAKHVMMPAHARPRHPVVERRLDELAAYAEECPLNRVEECGDGSIGIITSGMSYCYAKEVFGERASYLKLGLVFPMPDKMLTEFAASHKRVIVIEELDDFIETHCRKLGLHVEGKNLLPKVGEFSQSLLRERLLGEKPECRALEDSIPGRPPVLCPGCPHRGMFFVLAKMKLFVSGDIGCYTLGASVPLSAMDTMFCMGASVSALHGFQKIRPEYSGRSVAVIGDSTFIHSGITSLINDTYNKGVSTVIIADNSITGMTGHQQNPSTGKTLKEQEVPAVSLEDICFGAGVPREHIKVCDPQDTSALEKAIAEELAFEGTSVIIARRPCALLKYVKHGAPHRVNPDTCRACGSCMKLGCPALFRDDSRKVSIDPSLCVGCGLCSGICPFGAIDN